MDYQQLDDNILEDLYTWIDQIPLSRPKRDLKRDFADGGGPARPHLSLFYSDLCSAVVLTDLSWL